MVSCSYNVANTGANILKNDIITYTKHAPRMNEYKSVQV